MGQNIHFSYEPGKEDLETFASSLIKDFGQVDFKDADTIVTIGGDGSLLHVFRQAHNGQKVFGLIPPGSNSRGFWTNHGIETAAELRQRLSEVGSFKVNPLKATITFKDGSARTVRAFNEVAPTASRGQAMLVNLKINGPGSQIGPIRIMGDGIIVATPFGSTAMNKTYGGASIDIRNSGIAVTGKGIYEPGIGLGPTVASNETRFEIEFLSPHKRPVYIAYDGFAVEAKASNPFATITIEEDKDHAVSLLLRDDPSTRAFAAMIP